MVHLLAQIVLGCSSRLESTNPSFVYHLVRKSALEHISHGAGLLVRSPVHSIGYAGETHCVWQKKVRKHSIMGGLPHGVKGEEIFGEVP